MRKITRKRSDRYSARKRRQVIAEHQLRRFIKHTPTYLTADADTDTGHPAVRKQLVGFRQRYGVTQQWVGEQLGVDGNTVSKWEKGSLGIRHPKLLVLALSALAPTAEAYVAEKVERTLRS